MKNSVTIASLLFLLAGPAVSTATPDQGKAVAPLQAITAANLPQLEVRAPKKGDSSDDYDDDLDLDDYDDDSSGGSSGSDFETCTKSKDCEKCFGRGYKKCENTDNACYDPDINGTEAACEKAEEMDGAGSRLNGQNSLVVSALVALGLTAVML